MPVAGLNPKTRVLVVYEGCEWALKLEVALGADTFDIAEARHLLMLLEDAVKAMEQGLRHSPA